MTEIYTNYIPFVHLEMVKERFVPYGVEAKVKLVCIEVVGIGSLSVIHVEQREIFKHAVLSNASAIIMIHNHPSGDVSPSPADFKITKRIKNYG